jgi:hypothetical protein
MPLSCSIAAETRRPAVACREAWDFNRAALGAGLSLLLANRSLAQWYEGPSPPTSPPPKKFNIVFKNSPRTYNQVNVPRRHGAGRRFTIYWTWSYPWQANRDVTELDNRFSTMTEARRVAWPVFRMSRPTIAEVVLLSLRIGADVLRRHQPSIMAKRFKLATEMVRANAGLHADQARR